MRDQLTPLARFLVKDEATRKWKTVPYAEYVKANPRGSWKYCVLEVVSQRATIASVCTNGHNISKQIFSPPVIFAKGEVILHARRMRACTPLVDG